MAVTFALAAIVGGCAQTPEQGGTSIYGECVGRGVLILPIALIICAPAAAVVNAVESTAQSSARRRSYLARLERIGVLPQTELSPAGKLNFDKRSPKLNDRGRLDAKLVVDLDSKSSLRESSIEIDVEADCAAGTLHARNARSYSDVGGWGDQVAYRWTPTDSVEGMHPVLRTSLEKVCHSAAMSVRTATASDRPPLPPGGSKPERDSGDDREIFLNRFQLLGNLPETEISPAGELYLDPYSPKLNDRGHVDAMLVVGLDKKSPQKEYSIEFDVEADCTAGTLHAKRARSYNDIGGLGDLVATWSTPTDPVQGMHPILRRSLERVCLFAGLSARRTAAPNQPPPPPRGSNPGLFDPPFRR